MALSQLISSCSSQAIPLPTIFGSKFFSVAAVPVSNYTYLSNGPPNPNHGTIETRNLSFCNVTLTHTHPGQNDTILTNIWLPTQPQWNGRLQAIGGGGWTAGFYAPQTDLPMAAAVAEGYATVTTNGGVPSLDPVNWALLSPGNVDLLKVRNFASVALKDGALAAKSVINSFYGKPASYSYWSGCSQGGRQGYMFAQQYPDIFDGIAAAAPVIYIPQLAIANIFPKQVMYEMNSFPHPCELTTLTNLAITACDALDGLVDGILSTPGTCYFDAYAQIGSPVTNCSATNAPKEISKTAATVADAFWHGANGTHNTSLWVPYSYQANMTDFLAVTKCTDNGTCSDGGLILFPVWLTHFVEKDPSFDITSMSRETYEAAFRTSVREYDGLIGTSSADLRDFGKAGGKLLTYHGMVGTLFLASSILSLPLPTIHILHFNPITQTTKPLTTSQADQLIPYASTPLYYDAVTHISADVHDFFRFFGAPGLGHCYGGNGGYPAGVFDALVKWVEQGVAPDELEAVSARNVTSKLCAYPKKAVLRGNATAYGFDDFGCARKVVIALRDACGAISEYQQVIMEIEGLQDALTRLAALEPAENNIDHVNAIRGMALACTLPLQDFLLKMKRFKDAMSPFTTTKTMRSSRKKVQYAVSMSDEVKTIRAMISEKVISINLILATHASETLSRTEAKEGMSDIRQDKDSLSNAKTTSSTQLRKDAADSASRLTKQISQINDETKSTRQEVSAPANGVASSSSSTNALFSLENQILAIFRVFPAKLRALLQNVVGTNVQMYALLLQIHRKISATPTLALEGNIRMEDALGQIKSLPLEWFRHWEPLEGLLRAEFKSRLGAERVDRVDFRLVHTKRPNLSLDKSNWAQVITPGANVVMLMLITNLACPQSSCPRQFCQAIDPSAGPPRIRWPAETEPSEIQISCDDSIADSIFPSQTTGERVRAVSATSLSSSPPLLAWLAETEPPEDPTSVIQWRESEELALAERQRTDARDLEVFRNVEIVISLELETPRRNPQALVSNPDRFGRGATMLYRNIQDRYSVLGEQIARRFADQNWRRLQQLQQINGESLAYQPHHKHGESTSCHSGFSSEPSCGDDYMKNRNAAPTSERDVRDYDSNRRICSLRLMPP
ncbi:tannase-domain-containing protein [Ophiobolus disseminans]|uniref:Carboxylic ester hydrolase n=1 Tax=Ophiobolus disseminans TaxID=1469910 RepID=A0A6A6ZJ92_9PLEO|nr:tannase-domain-containing protein [Ophiobolus disseminans]